MSLIARAKSGERKVIPEGSTIGVCFAVYDLGTTHDNKWGKDKHQVRIMWELPEHRIDMEGKNKPMAISQKYTLSIHQKARLRGDLEAWRGKAFSDNEMQGFDLSKILGKACLVGIVHNTGNDGETYANVGAIMALPKAVQAPNAENDLKWFSFEEDEDIADSCPEWVSKEICESREWREREDGGPRAGDDSDGPAANDDPLPF